MRVVVPVGAGDQLGGADGVGESFGRGGAQVDLGVGGGGAPGQRERDVGAQGDAVDAVLELRGQVQTTPPRSVTNILEANMDRSAGSMLNKSREGLVLLSTGVLKNGDTIGCHAQKHR